MHTLYVVATPIGNLEDMTFRAVRTLKEVSLVLAEDTRHSRLLMDHYDIHTPMEAMQERRELQTPLSIWCGNVSAKALKFVVFQAHVR